MTTRLAVHTALVSAAATPHHQMQVSASADTVSIADIVYLGAQEGSSDGFSAATASAAGPGVRIRIRSFQRPPAISHVVVGPWCTWPILAPTGDPYCTSAFISVLGGEAATSTAIGDGAVSSSERTAALSDQQVSVSEQATVNQSIHNDGAVDAASGSGQCATDSQPLLREQPEENTIKSAQKCTEPGKKPNTKQGNRRKHKQKQRKQKREAEQKAVVAAAALATSTASVSEGVTCNEKEKTEEHPPAGDVTVKEKSQHSEIDEEERKEEEMMCEPLSGATETDKQRDGSDISVSVTDVANDSEQLSVNKVVMLTDKGANRTENCSDSGIVLVMFRQFEDDGSENVHVKNGENVSQSAELNAENLGGAVLNTVGQTVTHQNTKNRRSNKRGRRKKRRPPCDNIKEKRMIAAAVAPVAVCELADDLSHIPRERLSSFSSVSSNTDSNEDNEISDKSRVKRTYYFTSRDDCDACSDGDVNTISNSEINKEHDDIVTSEEEEEEVEEKRRNEVEEEECCGSVLAASDGATPAAGEDDQPDGSSSSRCSSDTDDDHADGQHFSTVFVVNSSTDGEESDSETVAVRLTKIQALPEDDLMTAAENHAVDTESTEPLLASEDGHVDTCLDTLENNVCVSEDSKSVVGVMLVSHRVSHEGQEPVHSEQTVHESECAEPETVPHCDTTVPVTEDGDTKISDPTVLANETLPTAFDNERVITEIDVKQIEENELRPTFMNKTVLEHVTTDMIASDREEGGGQSALGEVDEEKSEFLPVSYSAAVQKTEEGSSPAIEVSGDVTLLTDVDVIVPSAYNASLQASGKDAEGNVMAVNCTDQDTIDYNTLEHQHVERDFEVSEKDTGHKSSNLPVHSADRESTIMTDKTLEAEDNKETDDTVLKLLCSSLDSSTPPAHSTVDTPQFSVEPVPSEDEHTSGLCHSENKEIEEVEESVFVDEPFDGEEDGAVGGDSVLVKDDSVNCESNEGQIISEKPIGAIRDEIVASDNSENSHNNPVSSDVNSLCCVVDEICPHDYIQPDCSTVSMEICPIDPVSTAASGRCTKDIPFVCESKPALLSDQIIPKISEDISKENDDVNVSETVISAGLCDKSVFSVKSHDICNKNITDVLDTADVVKQTEELKSFSDVSTTGIAGTPAEFIQESFTGLCATENKQGENDISRATEDGIVSVGNAACNERESDAEVLRGCAEETTGGVTAAVDEKFVPIDNNNVVSASVDDSPVETAVTHVSVDEDKEEIRSSGDPVKLTVLQSAESASVAGEDQLQGVSCSVVTESAEERDAFDSPAGEPRYTSLVMITQNHLHQESMVSVVTSETTTLVPADVIVRHTNWEEDGGDASPIENKTSGLAGYFTLTLETSRTSPSCKKPLITKTRPQIIKKEETSPVAQQEKEEEDLVKVVTGGDTLSAVVCLEEGLADDDSWVEELDNTSNNHEDEEFATTTPTEEDTDSGDEAAVSSASTSSSSYSTDREEELRGYHRSAIDFTLHTIVEESCEESEVEQTLEEKKSKKQRPTSASELEKYFFYGLGGGAALGSPPGGCGTREFDSFSDTCSSIYSEGLESLGAEDVTAGGVCDEPIPAADDQIDPADLASSRLEKYFLTGFMGFSASDRNNRDSDGSGSVGSDSEGKPSPEQRRKKLVRARGTGRQHSSSLDNLVSGELSGAEQQQSELQESEDSSSTETDTHYEDGGLSSLSISASGFEKSDGQFDTVKRKKKKRSVSSSAGGRTSPASSHSLDEKKDSVLAKSPVADSTPDKIIASSEELSTLGIGHEDSSTSDDDEGCKTPQPEFLLMPVSELSASRNKQQSRDSGFIGSCDDLLKEQRTGSDSSSSSNNNDSPSLAQTQKPKHSSISSGTEELNRRSAVIASALDAGIGNSLPVAGEGVSDTNKTPHVVTTTSIPPATALTRKDSFNNWSSDEETNLMMSKMRVFFKTMVAASSAQGQQKTPQASPSTRQRGTKPPQLVYFENELTRLMKTVPGIRDEQVREIVEYLSSEDTWSDSYDSSDYTSSDLEGAYYMQQQGKVGAGIMEGKSELQEQISASCQQIISKFDTSLKGDDDHEDKAGALNRDTAFVYQRLVASFNKMAGDQQNSNSDPKGNHSPSSDSTPYSSPPLIAKVMHHIGSRLVALMHEVSGGEGLGAATSSPKVRYHHHRRLQAKLSAASTTTDDDSHTDTEQSGVELPGLPRSKSHDLLLEPGTRPTGVSSSMELTTSEEREASDYERFSWRGSFESALMAADSRTKLSLLQDSNNASSTTALAAKRRSAGDLLFAGKSSSREQLLDRVRSCGSIGGSVEDKIWNARRRRSSVPDANTCHAGSGTSADGDDDDDTDDDDDSDMRSTTLPRSLQTSCSAGTNSLPRLPTSATASPAPSVLSTASGGGIYKSHSVQHFGQGHVKSARYRPPGFSRPAAPKRALSAPGLQPVHPSRSSRGDVGRRTRLQSTIATPTPQVSDDASISEDIPPVVLPPHSKSASPSPIVGAGSRKGPGSVSSGEWPPSPEEDIDRLVAIHQQRSSLSSLGPRSDSLASVYSGAGEGQYGTVAVKGEVEFGLEYNYKAAALEIHVKQCRDLAAVDTKRNRSDPYVKVYLLPDKSKSGKRKTKVKKHTLNPVFDETLKFQITLHGLETRTLWLTVWHSDMFGRNDFLGEVMMALENKVFDDPSPHWYPLQERTEPFDDLLSYKGDLIIGLKFVPPDVTSAIQKKGKRSSRGSLNVLVKGAKHLTAVKANGTSDPFCKSYLLPDKGRSSKQKTPVLRRTCNPVWNYTFVYEDVSLQELSERSLELTVWDHDRLASNEFLGGLRFNLGTGKHYGKPVDWMDATGKEATLWQHMLERPNFWVEGCLTLRSSLKHRNSS